MRHIRVLDKRLMHLASGILLATVWFLAGCATQPAGQSQMEVSVPPTIEDIRTLASQENATVVEIVTSNPMGILPGLTLLVFRNVVILETMPSKVEINPVSPAAELVFAAKSSAN